MEEVGMHKKGGQERGWRRDVPFGANKPLGHRGCSVSRTLFSVTMTLPVGTRAQCIPPTPCPFHTLSLETFIIIQEYTCCVQTPA